MKLAYKKHLFLFLAPLAITLLALMACKHGSAGSPGRNSHNTELTRLDDSIRKHSPYALRICDSLIATAKDSSEFYDYYILRGKMYAGTAMQDSALIFARRTRAYAERQSKTPHTKTMLAIANGIEASVYHSSHSENEKTVALCQAAYDYIMASDHVEMAPDIAANLADAYIFIDDIPTAAKWYRRALFLVDSLKLPQERNITLYMGLGQIYTTLGDYESARHLYEKTDKQFYRMKPNMQTYFLINYGSNEYYSGDYPKALATFKRLERHLSKLKDRPDMDYYICRIDMADIYLNLDKTDSAAAYVGDAAAFFAANKIDVGVHYANSISIGLALRQHDYATIEKILRNEGDLDVPEQSFRNIRSRYLTQYFATIGDYRRAFENTVANDRQNDSTQHNIQNMRASEIMARFSEDTLRLNYEMKLKERDAKVQQSRATLWAVLALLAVVVSAVVTATVMSRKRKMQQNMDIFMLRLTAIRQRISPHFIFNVLNAKIGNAPKEEADILVDIAKLIRQNLNMSSHNNVTLYDEMGFVTRYVNLQRSLMDGGFDFIVNAPDDETMRRIKVPTMFVQILVENSVKHALKGKEGRKSLRIDIDYSDDKRVCIAVADNGPGFDITRRDTNDSTHVGLDVIRKTMALVNKGRKKAERMEMNIENKEDELGKIAGCRISLIIPQDIRLS